MARRYHGTTVTLALFVVTREAMILPRHIVTYYFSPFFLRTTTTTSMKSQSSSIESVPLPSSSSASTSALRSAVPERDV